MARRPLLKRLRRLPRVLVENGEATILESVALPSPERLTMDRAANEQHLYFSSPSLLQDGSALVFLSDRSGSPNLFLREFATGRERQLSDNRDGFLKSYVYFDGNPYRGLGKASPSVDAAGGFVYYIQGRQIVRAGMAGGREVLATLPADQMTGYTSLSPDGERLCVPTVDGRALGGSERLRRTPTFGVARRVRRENLSSYLRVYSTRDGRELVCEPVRQAWITHVHFCPADPERILYNHEWSRHSGIRRMWLWDGRQHVQLRDEADGRRPNDWVCHEFWSQDGNSILYHGRFDGGRDFVGRIGDSRTVELALPAGWRQYGHYHGIVDTCLVSDGYYRAGGGWEGAGCPWLSRLDVDWQARRIVWSPLTAHLSSWGSQDAHPHPWVDPAGRFAFFTSDRDGRLAVYRVALGER